MKFLILMAMAITLFSTTFTCVSAQDTGVIGEVRASLLAPTAFKNLNGDGWVLMNGQNLKSNDPLRKISKLTAVPDARGRYLRMVDNGKGLIPERTNKAGQILNMSTSRPKVNFTTNMDGLHRHIISGGSHQHHMHQGGKHRHKYSQASWKRGRVGDLNFPCNMVPVGPSGFSCHVRSTKTGYTASLSIKSGGAHSHNVSERGKHYHIVDGGGDKETRPHSMTVYYYVKIRDSSKCKVDTSSAVKTRKSFDCIMNKLKKWARGKKPMRLKDVAWEVARLRSIAGGHLTHLTRVQERNFEKMSAKFSLMLSLDR